MRIGDISLTLRPATPVRRVAIGLVLLMLHTGCSMVQPIPAWDGDIDRFQLPPTPPAAGPVASPAAGRFVGGLGPAIEQIDERRRQLLTMANDVVTGNSLYNLLLWPVTAGVLYNISQHGASNPGLIAALGVAIYGMVSSGIPDRHKQYLQTARQLHCTILSASADLYLAEDFQATPGRPLGTAGNVAPTLPGAGTVDDVVDELKRQITSYERARLGLTLTLRPKPADPDRRDALARRRDVARGEGSKAAPAADPRDQIEVITGGYLDEASEKLRQLLAFRGRVMRSGESLQARATTQFDDLRSTLSDKAAPAQRPDVALAQVGALMQAVAASAVQTAADVAAASGAGKVKQQSGTARPGEYRIPTRLLDMLDANGRAVAGNFDWIRGAELGSAAQAAGQWLARDAEETARGRALVLSLGCVPGPTAQAAPVGKVGASKALAP